MLSPRSEFRLLVTTVAGMMKGQTEVIRQSLQTADLLSSRLPTNLAQISLWHSRRSDKYRDEWIEALEILAQESPENGTTWFALALYQSRAKMIVQAKTSLARARRLLGDIAAIEHLSGSLEME